MRQEAISNPFTIMNYNHSWSEIRKQVDEVVDKFPHRYKLAYHNDYDQKLILIASFDFRIFSMEKSNLIYISKIDSTEDISMLAYEAKNYSDDINTNIDYDKGFFFIESFFEDLSLVH